MECNSDYLKNLEQLSRKDDEEKHKILCNHCKRTKHNNISCLGICVADSDY